ncbi:TIGR03086 family protein [Streptomyces sp. ISL-36]|uniref:TIGR03086 family metal-binding protein n=1 Tax=Streptomyces sp. ISL-36 TaxID=2819182 RepID=UPI001BEAC589|nr:TIGR03086 family metal-binding protein [Streptomyces sp. ISL-36]MBT2444516.1 TIGR03086 family protein [Streptomyces sp. ISL-36]
MTETANASGAPSARPSADPRGGLFKAVDLAAEVLAALRPDQYEAVTPCPDYTVRDLANHLVSVLRRVAVLGAGGSFMSVPHFAEDVADGDWAEAWTASAKEFHTVWSDPAVLGRQIALPWGPVPGAVASVIYTNEFVLHIWDLAKATGQSPVWDPEMLAAPLANMRRAVPAEPRGGQVPFGPVVEVHEDAPDIDKLVGWYGRRP